MSGGASGIGRRGGLAAVDTLPDSIGGSWDFPTPPAGNLVLWGQHGPGHGNLTFAMRALGSAGVSGAGSDVLRAVPHFFPRRCRIGTLGFYQGNPNSGTGRLRLGLYSSGPTQFPGTRLFDSGDIGPWPDPGGVPQDQWQSVAANIEVPALSLIWMAWNYSDQLRIDNRGVYVYQSTTGTPSPLGYIPSEVIMPGDTQYRTIPSTNAGHYGWKVAQAYGVMPATFPTLNARVLCHNLSIIEPTTWLSSILAVGFTRTDL